MQYSLPSWTASAGASMGGVPEGTGVSAPQVLPSAEVLASRRGSPALGSLRYSWKCPPAPLKFQKSVRSGRLARLTRAGPAEDDGALLHQVVVVAEKSAAATDPRCSCPYQG
jgi:hypothetical protein